MCIAMWRASAETDPFLGVSKQLSWGSGFIWPSLPPALGKILGCGKTCRSKQRFSPLAVHVNHVRGGCLKITPGTSIL